MRFPPFLLDQWLDQKNSPGSKIDYDLGSSTGPQWTLRELLALEETDLNALLDTRLLYTTPAGTPELREMIGATQGVDPDCVQVVTGAAEALLILFSLAAEPGANVVLPNPGFPTNTALPEAFGIEARTYTLRAENAFRMDPDEIRSLVDRNTRLVLVNSPHNPTGAVIGDDEMESLHDFCAERGVQLVADEVYHPIYYGDRRPSSTRLPHVTVLGDFSKALCLSGLRTGWIIERDAARRERYLNARSYFTVSNTALGEQLAALALRNREPIYDRCKSISAKNLKVLDSLFAKNSEILNWVRPSGGMTAFPWLVDGSDAREFCQRLAKRGVMLAPGDCFGMRSHFRIGFGATGDRFPRAIDRLSEFLRGESRAAGV
jgi:aspartate/methionine/tyrosine aminotransferase